MLDDEIMNLRKENNNPEIQLELQSQNQQN